MLIAGASRLSSDARAVLRAARGAGAGRIRRAPARSVTCPPVVTRAAARRCGSASMPSGDAGAARRCSSRTRRRRSCWRRSTAMSATSPTPTSAGPSPTGTTATSTTWPIAQHIEAKFDRVIERVERQRPPGRLLDVGAGPGFMVSAARARGWDAEGIDLNPWAVAHARDVIGVQGRGRASKRSPRPTTPDDDGPRRTRPRRRRPARRGTRRARPWRCAGRAHAGRRLAGQPPARGALARGRARAGAPRPVQVAGSRPRSSAMGSPCSVAIRSGRPRR